MDSALIDKLHKQKDTPEFKDHCNHPEGSYVGSIFDGMSLNKHTWLDIYVYKGSFGESTQDVCIRYGDEDCEYISPGNLLNILANRQNEVYVLVIHVLLKKGKIVFIPRG